jgi:hypothetical protein
LELSRPAKRLIFCFPAKSSVRQAIFARNVDTSRNAPIEYSPRWRLTLATSQLEDQVVSLVKIIMITIAVILSILFFGRFLF